MWRLSHWNPMSMFATLCMTSWPGMRSTSFSRDSINGQSVELLRAQAANLIWKTCFTVIRSPRWPLPGLSSWYPFFKWSHSISVEDRTISADCIYMCPISIWVTETGWHDWVPGGGGGGGGFKNAYELLNLRALKISMLYKNHIVQCMGKIFCVEFQRVPLKFHTKYLAHTLKNVDFIHRWKFKSS